MDALNAMKLAVGARGWTDDPAQLEPRLTDWRGRKRGAADLMLSPATTQELWCRREATPRFAARACLSPRAARCSSR
jgi:hypothetical protein